MKRENLAVTRKMKKAVKVVALKKKNGERNDKVELLRNPQTATKMNGGPKLKKVGVKKVTKSILLNLKGMHKERRDPQGINETIEEGFEMMVPIREGTIMGKTGKISPKKTIGVKRETIKVREKIGVRGETRIKGKIGGKGGIIKVKEMTGVQGGKIKVEEKIGAKEEEIKIKEIIIVMGEKMIGGRGAKIKFKEEAIEVSGVMMGGREETIWDNGGVIKIGITGKTGKITLILIKTELQRSSRNEPPTNQATMTGIKILKMTGEAEQTPGELMKANKVLLESYKAL